MGKWSQQDVQKRMSVYSADSEHIGHVAEVYEEAFLVHKGFFFASDRYFPYNIIARLEGERLELTLNSEEARDRQWEKRPDYEDHLGDPTQLFYDRGHGVHDPYDETV